MLLATRRAHRCTGLVVFLLATILIAAPRPAAAQGQPRKFENLKYFPKDIPRDSLLSHMHGFTRALGVRCQFCHVEDTTARAQGGRERLIFKLDDKPTKRKARFMLRMVDSLNNVVLAKLPDRSNPPVMIQCVTCHRGSPYPQTLATVLTEADHKYGVDSAVARYKMLREDMVSGRYDFSEASLTEIAETLGAQGKTADAIALLQLNQQYNPNSANIDFAMAELYRQSGNEDRAIAEYRMVLQKRPNDRRAMQRLRQLGAGTEH
ncbi:MAG TPA: c-type cytochrome [Gemmatimonadaceae bacterium]|nr:c-type cytochrome [Gemmatimonadaceae bacterium]